MKKIAICICTRNRPNGLKRLLASLEKMETPADAKVRIIIVENDSKPRSRHIVQAFSPTSKFRIDYHLETRQGIAFARNRSVKEANGCEFCCFVDDDQIVASDWLIELLKCQAEFKADGVWGCNPPVFNKRVPAYIRKFHTREAFNYGDISETGYTNCLLLRKKFLDSIKGPFDLRLNFAGGEDIYLTSLISRKGGVIRCNPKAVAYEVIPNSRTTLGYILKRTFRNSNTDHIVDSLVDTNFSSLSAVRKLFLRLGFGVLILIPYLLTSGADRLKGLIKIAAAIGGLAFFLGKHNQFYK